MVLILALLTPGIVSADYIKWVDFNVSYEALDKALSLDIRSQEVDQPVSWIVLLAMAACRQGNGSVGQSGVQGLSDRQKPPGAIGRFEQIL